MTRSTHRRAFLGTSSLGLGGLAFLNQLPAVSAADARLDPKLVRLDSGIEPIVRLLEDTPRGTLLEEIGRRVKSGLAYREVLTALLLAGVRNIQPRPSVGFKFHAVLVVNSAHCAALAGPDRDRWLPIFWAIDNFKNSQAQNAKETGWRMKPVDETAVPAAREAKARFAESMTAWDEAKADGAAAAIARTCSAGEAFDLFARFGCRDFRDIGHKAIFVANAFRALEAIGWHHAEPVLRSLALALLRREGAAAPSGDLPADRVGVRNLEQARRFAPTWNDGAANAAAVPDLLAALREGSDADAGERVTAAVNGGLAPQSVWDAVLLGAGELLMRQPGIVGLHAMTTANALRHAYDATGDTETRKLLLLQAASFLPLFRKAMGDRGQVANVRIDTLAPEDQKSEASVEAVYAALTRDKARAAQLALGLMAGQRDAGRALINTGRKLVFLKGTDSHDYKFSVAAMEDYAHVSPGWRDRYLAAGLYWLKGSGAPDAPLVARTRAALA